LTALVTLAVVLIVQARRRAGGSARIPRPVMQSQRRRSPVGRCLRWCWPRPLARPFCITA